MIDCVAGEAKRKLQSTHQAYKLLVNNRAHSGSSSIEDLNRLRLKLLELENFMTRVGEYMHQIALEVSTCDEY